MAPEFLGVVGGAGAAVRGAGEAEEGWVGVGGAGGEGERGAAAGEEPEVYGCVCPFQCVDLGWELVGRGMAERGLGVTCSSAVSVEVRSVVIWFGHESCTALVVVMRGIAVCAEPGGSLVECRGDITITSCM